MRVLITVKTYPIPSSKYDELVCTAGVTETGEFVRLYPINFRDLPFDQQYRKYQWIEVEAQKHAGRDVRKESYRPDCSTLRTIGKMIPSRGNWSERSNYVLRKEARSLEDLQDRQKADKTSLGIFRPKKVHDLVISPDDPEWKPSFTKALAQARLWENRKHTLTPPRKVPFKFRYQFKCDDSRCTGKHEIMVEDWEVGALFWRLRDRGKSPDEAAAGVRHKFFDEICGPGKDTRFLVGTHSAYPNTWLIIGLFYPKRIAATRKPDCSPGLFDRTCSR